MVKRIAIVGRDADAWLAALTLQASLGKSAEPVEIVLVELPSRLGPQDFYATIPTQRAFHQLLGLPESQLLSAAQGLPSLGYRYSNWSPGAPSFFHVYDTAGAAIDGVDFLQYWNRARRRGLQAALDEFSVAAAAARRGRVPTQSERISTYSHASYGYNLSALAYLKGIAGAALKASIRHRPAEVESVQTRGDHIASLLLKDGSRVQADLFIDASGSGELIEVLGTEFRCWDKYFLCDSVILASAGPFHPTPSFNQVSALDAGWLGLYPLASRTGVMMQFSSRFTDREKALAAVNTALGRPVREPILRSREAGLRDQPWRGNCVSVGGSAGRMDGLEGVQLHLLHTSLTYLLALFPVTDDWQLERDAYNRRIARHAERLRDFQLACYHLNGRSEPFWRDSAAAPLSEPLAHKIALFRARGAIAMDEDETFQEENWAALFAGCGLQPRSSDPLVRRLPEEEQIRRFQSMLTFVAEQVEQMPDMDNFLKNHLSGNEN